MTFSPLVQGLIKSIILACAINAAFVIYMCYVMKPFNHEAAWKKYREGILVHVQDLMSPFLLPQRRNEGIYATINSFSCPREGRNVELVAVIPSAPFRESARMAIRRTWGRFGARTDVSIFFIIGRTSNLTLIKSIEKERYMYEDILLGNFTDTYNNLTVKTISMLRWVKEYCSQAKFLLKSDDDVFINMLRLLNYILLLKQEEEAIYGRVVEFARPIRDNKSKHYLSYDAYEPKLFPNYADGPAYLIPVSLVNKLYNSSLYHKIINLEDVFLTGIVATNLNISRIPNADFHRSVKRGPCSIESSISIHEISEPLLFDYHKKVFHGQKRCKKYLYLRPYY